MPYTRVASSAAISLSVAAARLSDRYIADRFLPDKAIDLVDEAAARLKMELASMPRPIERLERRVISLQIEQQAGDVTRLSSLLTDIAGISSRTAGNADHTRNVADRLRQLTEAQLNQH
mgnify:CR=1 FL=1